MSAAQAFPNRSDALALDAADPLAPLRAKFDIPAGLIYLDGNSLGVLPRATPARVAQVVQQEWGQGLIASWNSAGWITLAQRVGDKIATLVGAGPGELLVADSTSVNLYKVLQAALRLQGQTGQPVILSERSNFPTDLYIAAEVARAHGGTLELAATADLPARLQALRGRVAVLLLTHVNYRSGRLHDMAGLTAAAHAAGALAVWDLAHSTGAVPVDLHAADADFAVGCGYKYLNGGPGAPAFVWAHPRHANAVTQPLAGWLGHAAPFAFVPGYVPAPGIARFQCGTPPILSLAALDCGVETVLSAGADGRGATQALRAKSLALARLFIAGVRTRCPQLRLLTPADDALRGSQVCLGLEGAEPGQGHAVMQALIARGVVGDFRAGDPTHPDTADDILRFGFAPLYNGFAEAWDAVKHLQQVLDSGQWREARFGVRAAVT